jgi:hypothetical protein
MRRLILICLVVSIVLSANSARSQPAGSVPQKSRESYQADIDATSDRIGAALRINRFGNGQGEREFRAARAHLLTLDELLSRAPAFVLSDVDVPDRIRPFIDDARDRLELSRQIMAECIRHSQLTDPGERGEQMIRIRALLERANMAPVTDTEDRSEITGLERQMRQRSRDEEARLQTLGELHEEFLRIVARMTKLNAPVAGDFEGTFLIDAKNSKLIAESDGQRFEFPAQESNQVGFIFFTVRGTEVTGEAAYGEGEGRAVIRLKGRYDLETERIELEDAGGTLPAPLPAAAVTKVELKIKGKPELVWPGKSENRPITPETKKTVVFDGTWKFRLPDVEVPYQESEKAPVKTIRIVELLGQGSWNASGE